MKPDMKYEADWSRTGQFDHPLSDISGYVLSSSWRRGRPGPPPAYDTAGTATISLDNSSSIFSSFNAQSPLYGLVLPNVRIRISMKKPSSSEWRVKFTGDLENITPNVGESVGTSTVLFSVVGLFARWSSGEAQVPLQENITTGTAINALLDNDSFPADARDVDTGQTTLSKWWAKLGSKRLDAIRQLQNAEFGRAREGEAGDFKWEDRAHIFTAPHDLPQATFGAGGLFMWDIQQQEPLSGIYNYARGEVKTFNVSENGVVLAEISDVANGRGGTPPIVPGNGTLEYVIEFPNPGSPSNYIGVDSWGIIDLEANTQADGTGDDITEFVTPARTPLGSKLKVLFANNHASPAHLIVFRPKGTAIVQGDPVVVISEDAVSQGKYGKREYDFSSAWFTDPAIAKQHLDYAVAIYKDPPPRLTFEVKGSYDEAHLEQCIERDTGERIRVAASGEFYGLFIDREFIIDSLAYVVKESREVEMTIACTVAPSIQLAATAAPYTPKVIPDDPGGQVEVSEVPDQVYALASAMADRIVFTGGAMKWNQTIDHAEFRAKFVGLEDPAQNVDLRTAQEGGTLAHDGQTSIVMSGLPANWQGATAQVLFGTNLGKWFYAFRFHNAEGWSVWTDGNDVPSYVTQCVLTAAANSIDDAPPQDFSVSIVAANQPGCVQIVATRPQTEGNSISNAFFQLRDRRTGSRRAIDDNAGASVVYYDGAAVNHTYDPVARTLTRELPGGYGDLPAGTPMLLLYDVRQGRYDCRHTKWAAEINSSINIAGGVIGGVNLLPGFAPDSEGRYADLRVKLVKAPWNWSNLSPSNSDGYQGINGYFDRGYIDRGWVSWPYIQPSDQTYTSPPMAIPAGCGINDLEARVWFSNGYSTDDDDRFAVGEAITSTNPNVITVTAGVTTTIDCNLGTMFLLPLTRDTTLHFLHAQDGKPVLVIFVQDGVGGRVVTLPDSEFSEGLDACFAISPEPGRRTYVVFAGNATTDRMDVLKSGRGY